MPNPVVIDGVTSLAALVGVVTVIVSVVVFIARYRRAARGTIPDGKAVPVSAIIGGALVLTRVAPVAVGAVPLGNVLTVLTVGALALVSGALVLVSTHRRRRGDA